MEASKDVAIRDAGSGELVVLEPIECEVPEWFAEAVDNIDKNLLWFNELVRECRTDDRGFCTAFQVLTKQYEALLSRQERIYHMAKTEGTTCSTCKRSHPSISRLQVRSLRTRLRRPCWQPRQPIRSNFSICRRPRRGW